MEDNKIIDLFFERSESAITHLSEKYGRLGMSIATNILKNTSDAEECLNDALLGVWNTIPPTRPESLISYVCKIVRNQALKRYEYNTAQKRNSFYDTALEELGECIPAEQDVEKEIEANELARDIEKFLDKQSRADRTIFMRRYFFVDSYAQIASLTGLSEKNVSVKLTRMRGRLKDYLTERGYL
ncbi:MAG: RNA polymerase sigma factor [Lachnospiraceae bacterium]|jgi:RNA polymerase sigma factor (sigma-70 family)